MNLIKKNLLYLLNFNSFNYEVLMKFECCYATGAQIN